MHIPASTQSAVLVLSLAFTAHPTNAAAPPIDLPGAARGVLQRHCARCHEKTSYINGGLSHITDLHSLVSRGLVVPGKPLVSRLYQRIHDGEMPPRGKNNHFTGADGELLRRWIRAGAPAGTAAIVYRPLTEDESLRLVCADLQKLPARQRRFFRYLTLGHLGGRPASEQQTLRHALAKVVNSLSWHARLRVPDAIDRASLVYRVDLRHYRWTARQWDRLAAAYPYRASEPRPLLRDAAALAGCEQPLLRADWFVANATRPPFYHDFLQLPTTDRALERLLQIDVPGNLEEETALRAGFNGSGVARANRLIERHDAVHGAYWRSYDFSDNTGRQNLFQYPLGPASLGSAAFQHAGGEIIFHLPNGLQGYMLVKGDGARIDRAPAEIVNDPKRPDHIVENGVSCMGCHVQGIIPKDDQVRAHVEKNRRAFTAEQREAILGLYVPADRLRAAVKEDNERFAVALKRLQIPAGEPEPVAAAVQRYEEVFDLTRAADETGTSGEILARVIRKTEELSRTLGPLLARGGTVQRQVFEESYPRLVAELPAPGGAVSARPATGEFRGHRGAVRTLVWAPDGKTFASAGEDGTIRVWNVADGSHLQMDGRMEEPSALAFSPDCRRLLAGGADRVLVLWDTTTGRRLARLVGHTAGIRAVVFSPDGKLMLSAGVDRAIRVWDVTAKTQIRALTGHTGTITALAISFDGTLVLSAGVDHKVRLWNLATSKSLAQYDHPREVRALAFAADGKILFTGGNDGEVTARSVDRHGGAKRIGTQAGTVVSLVARSGELLSVSVHGERGEQSLRVIDLATGRSRAVGPAGVVEAAAVSRDGRALLALEGGIRVVNGLFSSEGLRKR